MNYSSHLRNYSNYPLIYIEEYNKEERTVLFDFIDSNQYQTFNTILNFQLSLEKATMVFLNNYKGRRIQENTVYALNPEILNQFSNQVDRNLETNDSFLIGFEFDCSSITEQIFDHSISQKDLDNIVWTGNKTEDIIFDSNGKIGINVRNVGHGNWNEISLNNTIKYVFDAGASIHAKKDEILTIIGNRNKTYPTSKPILILSHWDKDHYHSLLGMLGQNLNDNFSSFICRNIVPTLTSRILFQRLFKSIGYNNVFTLSANSFKKGNPIKFKPVNSLKDQVVLYNSTEHKNKNISGLALSVKAEKGSVILPGDANYDQISRDILCHLNYPHTHHLVVPHHGGNAGKYIYKVPNKVKVDKAIISFGPNRYKHPTKANLIDLMNSGFYIRKTFKEKKDIKFYLN